MRRCNRPAWKKTDNLNAYRNWRLDLYSLQGLRNLGPALSQWHSTWATLVTQAPKDLTLPMGSMTPAGYVLTQHVLRNSRPTKSNSRWLTQIPAVYRTAVLGLESQGSPTKVEADSNCLARLRHYRSLMPLAVESRKPMFHLRPADGAIGAHVEAVLDCRADFATLARKIAAVVGVELP